MLKPVKTLIFKKLDPGETVNTELARSMGAYGERVGAADSLALALRRALNAGKPAVFVTGASGYLGRLLVKRLAGTRPVVATDLRPVPESERLAGIEYVPLDIRDASAVARAIGVVTCLERGVCEPSLTGTYNLAGDGAMTLPEIARALKSPTSRFPPRSSGADSLSGVRSASPPTAPNRSSSSCATQCSTIAACARSSASLRPRPATSSPFTSEPAPVSHLPSK